MRNGEDHVHIGDGQQFLAARREPLISGVGLTLRTMPGTTRVERGLMAAMATAIEVSTECRRAAVLDGKQHADVQPP